VNARNLAGENRHVGDPLVARVDQQVLLQRGLPVGSAGRLIFVHGVGRHRRRRAVKREFALQRRPAGAGRRRFSLSPGAFADERGANLLRRRQIGDDRIFARTRTTDDAKRRESEPPGTKRAVSDETIHGAVWFGR
jgi:hypothetical protein